MIWSAPAAFWLAFVLLAVVAMHAVRQHPRRLGTTTLHIWRTLAEDAQTAPRIGKVVLNIPLILQLLLMALLVLAMASPLWLSEVSSEKDVVLVVDASASMNAGEGGSTRFELAREAAFEMAAALEPGQHMALVEMARTPRLVEPFTDDGARLRDAIAGLNPTESQASLKQALGFALSLAADEGQRQVVLIGDGAYHEADGSAELLNERVKFVRAGSGEPGPAGENVGIVQFAYRPHLAPRKGGELLVSLRSYAEQPRAVDFSVELGDVPLMGQSFQVQPDTQYSLVIPVPAGIAGVARAALNPADGLVTDNQAFAVVAPRPQARILIAGDPDPPLLAALRAVPNTQLTYHSGETGVTWAGGGVTAQAFSNFDLLLFNRLPAPSLEHGTVVVIGEVSPQSGARADGWIGEHRVTRWQPGDALLRSLDPRQLGVSRALRLVPEPGAQVLVSGREGPLVIRRESGAARVVTLAFDLRERGFSGEEAFPLLMSNLVDWVRPRSGWAPDQRVKAGDAYEWWPTANDAELTVTGPGGQFWSYPAGSEPVRFQHTQRVGIYTFESNERLDRVAVNLLDPVESRVEFNPAIVGRLAGEIRSGTRTLSQELWPLLAILGALILLAEWAYWLREN